MISLEAMRERRKTCKEVKGTPKGAVCPDCNGSGITRQKICHIYYSSEGPPETCDRCEGVGAIPIDELTKYEQA
jgi:DnaJ-class molecular chaperone